MAARNPLNELCVPGRLVSGPTDLSAAYPYGGTELGNCRDMVWRPIQNSAEIIAEEWGGVATENVFLGETCILMALLSSWDADALAIVFPGGSTGGSGRALIQSTVSGSTGAGNLLSSRAVKLLFVPDAVSVNPAILVYAAAPMVDSAAAMRLRRNVETGIACAWRGLPDSLGRTFAAGALEDLTL